MDKMSNYEKVSVILQIITLLIGLGGAIYQNVWIFSIILFVPFISVILLLRAYIKQKEYIQFIEYLYHNEHHNFRILPLLRMYLHKKKLYNYVHILNAHITYIAEPNTEAKDSNCGLLGDCEIHYVFDIANKKLPHTFKFLCANDNSNGEPQIKYRFDPNGNYYVDSSKTETVHPHWGGKMKEVAISFDNSLIANKRVITLEIVVTMKKMFCFDPSGRDTILCLPINYSTKIDQIDFEIDVRKFKERPFYCNAKRIYCKDLRTTIDGINCTPNEDKSVFNSTIIPENNIENAYYFRIGLGEQDPDYA